MRQISSLLLICLVSLVIHQGFCLLPSDHHPRRHLERLYLSHPLANSSTGFSPWLHALEIKLPGKNFSASLGPARLTLRVPFVQCNHLSMNSPRVSVDQSSLTSHLELGRLSADCFANWTLTNTVDGSLNATGHVLVDINNKSSATVDLQLKQDEDMLPDRLSTTKCLVSLEVSKIHFSKDDAWILKLFSPLLKDFLEVAVPPILCYKLEDDISPNASIALKNLSSLLSPLLAPVVNAPSPPIPSGSVNLTRNALVGLGNYVINNVFGTTGPRSVNAIINELTNGSGSILAPNVSYIQQEIYNLTGMVVPISANISLPNVAQLQVEMLELNLTGLNNWTFLEAFVPVSAYELQNTAAFGKLTINVSISITAQLDSDLADDDVGLRQMVYAAVDVYNMTVMGRTAVAMNESLLSSFQPNTELQSIPCLLWAVDVLNFTELDVNCSSMVVRVIDVGDESQSTIPNVTQAISSFFVWGLDALAKDLPQLVRGFAHQDFRPLVNEYIALNVGYNSSCPDPEDNSIGNLDVDVTIAAFVIGGVIFSAVMVCWVTHRVVGYHGESAPVYKLASKILGGHHHTTRGEDRAVNSSLIDDMDDDDVPHSDASLNFDGCLFLDPNISWVVQLLVPFLAIMTIPLFASSHTSVGATSYLKIYINDTVISSPPLVSLSFSSTVSDMWDASVYPLAILICLFSGAWPYVKLIGIIIAWLLPAWILKPSVREWILMIIDQLGKWSLIDIFVVLLMSVSLHSVSHTPADVQVDTMRGASVAKTFVEFRSAFYTFLTGTVLSLIISHVALAWHHRAARNPILRSLARVERREPTKALWAERLNWLPDTRIRLTKVTRFLVAFALFSSFILAAVGLFVHSFYFKFVGFGAEIFKVFGTPITKSYSAFTLILDLPGSVMHSTQPGPILTQVVLFIFIIAVPLLYIPTAFLFWVIPMRAWMLRKAVIVLEILNAWAALDVFTFAIIATLLELPTFSEYMLDRSCHWYTGLINHNLPSEFHVHTCLEVNSGLKEGIWVMLTASVLYNVAGAMLIHVSHNVLARREEDARRADTDAWRSSGGSDVSLLGGNDQEDVDGGEDWGEMVASSQHPPRCTSSCDGGAGRWVTRALVWVLRSTWLVSTTNESSHHD